jgi:hypothetical protein
MVEAEKSTKPIATDDLALAILVALCHDHAVLTPVAGRQPTYDVTGILRGCASGFFPTRTVRTPFFRSALIPPRSAVSGSS